jgi:hypothetical protein
MRTFTVGCPTAALFAWLAFGQTPAGPGLDRVLYFTHTDTPQNLQEITNIVRAMADTPATFDAVKKTMSMHGTSAQIALAEWLLSEMDRPVAPTPSPVPAIQPYRNERGQDEVVRVFSLAYAVSPVNLQQLTNLLRSTSDMQRMFPYNALKLLVARGSAEQMALADWLVRQLDRPPGAPAQDAGTREIRVSNTIVNTVRVFYLTHDQSPQDVQAIVSQVRATVKVQRIYPYNAQHAVAVSGTAEQIAAVGQLVKELDQPPSR